MAQAVICPSGKSMGEPSDFLSIPAEKNISFRGSVETVLLIRRPVPTEGRFAIVTNAGRDAVDASGASDEGADLRTAKSCGPDAPTLASSFAEVSARRR
jgi:hypothetical protein